MMKCWHADKDCRPTFSELVKILDKIIELHTSSEVGNLLCLLFLELIEMLDEII